MIKEFAVRNGLNFMVSIDELAPTEPQPYVVTEKPPMVAEEAAGVYQTAKTAKIEDMEKVIIDVKNETDLEYIEQVLSERGISFRKENDVEFQRRLSTRKIMAEASLNWPSYDISMDEIAAMVKEARAERYARKQDKDNY
jgi:superfamily I DNA/RNA helicase